MPLASPSASVIGLGPMGLPVAQNLRRAGVDVTAWNRSRGPAEVFQDDGGRIVSSVEGLTGQVVLSLLPDVDELEPLLGGLVDRAGRIVVVMSTSSPRRMLELQRSWGTRLDFADAPMSGGVDGAKAASLSVMVGAPSAVFDRIVPVLRLISSTVEHVGPLGAGMLAKLCNQIVVGSTLAALGEAMALAERGGISLQALIRIWEGGLADSAVLRTKGDLMALREYVGGGSTKNQVKDLRYAADEAEQSGIAPLMTMTALELFEATVTAGYADADHSSVREVYPRMDSST